MKYGLAWLWLVASSCATYADENWYANDTTHRLEQLITDFRLNDERVALERRAFVAKGQYQLDKDNELQTDEVIYIGAFEGRDNRFYADSMPAVSSQDGSVHQSWNQHLIFDGKLYRRDSLAPYGQDPEVTDDKAKMEEHRRRLVKFNPIQMSIGFASAGRLFSSEEPLDHIMTVGELRSARYDKEGNIVQTNDLAFNGRVCDYITFVYGKSSFFLPISTSYWKNSEHGSPTLVSRVETKWEKHGDYYFPARLNTYAFRTRRTDFHELGIRLAIGSAVEGKSLVDVKLPDWREPLRILFDEDWERAGRVFPLLQK